ncbi:hypothetical protein [Verrucomicrobium spinosum]|uniref:hypothetical protein n=1 Tax=Verrucomicrobium spinosum TaxID=2736 RepID=UPI00210A69D9|nr:hypothetical protein [Verrucomicrobium spinosum]
MSEDQKRWTSEARPTEKTTLRLLDLTKVPTEKDLRMAGQLGEELQPTRSLTLPPSLIPPPARSKKRTIWSSAKPFRSGTSMTMTRHSCCFSIT